MVLWEGGPPISGRWYFVSDETPFSPNGDAFGSSYWTRPEQEPPRPVGEIRPSGDRWVDGSPPPFLCTDRIGGDAELQGLATSCTPRAYPCCGWLVNGGMAAEASGATGAVSTRVQVAGLVAEASGATGALSTRVQVGGLVAEASGATGDIEFTPGNPNPIITTCSNCSGGTYTYWYLTLSGVSGSADCVAQNGTYQLANSPGSCAWLIAYPSSGPTHISFFITTLTNVVLNIYDPTGFTLIAVYNLGGGTWNCLGSNTMYLVSSTACSGWPSTITLASS